MVLYTCSFGQRGSAGSSRFGHPCGLAARALERAGHTYMIRRVKAGRFRPWTWRVYARERAEVERLSGQRRVPILVLDDGNVVSGSANIITWAQANPAR